MSRRNRLKSARATAATTAVAPVTPAAAVGGYGFSGGFGTNGHVAADFSRLRGYVYFPQLDTRREITPYTRVETMRKSRWFCVNHGLPRRIVFGLSRLAAGTGLTPYPLTRDRTWNEEALAYANRRFESPFTFDVGGRFDFYSAQPFVLACHYRDGDQATALTESQTRQAMFALYEGHQIGTGVLPDGVDPKRWYDGVRTDRNNKAVAYRFLDEDGAATELPASSVMLLAEYERASQVRSTSILEHAVNHLHDGTDIVSFIKTGVKLNNLYGYWMEKQPTAGGGAPASPYGTTAAGPVSRVPIDSAGNKITLEQIIGGGAIPELDPGVSIKFNNSAHPHPNQLSLLDYLIRDIAWGVGVAPDLLWNIAALGGANTRFVLADAQSWIEKEQEKLVRLFCQRAYVYTIAKGVASGQLRRSPDPEWWKVGWIPPPRLTVDFGRDGKLYIEQNRSAMLTLKTVFGWQGQDWQPQIDQWLDEVKYIKDGMATRGVTWDDVQQFRSSSGNRPDAFAATGPTDPIQASAFLAELAKDPARARAFMSELQKLPAAA
jgi:capsid protein